MVCKINYCSEFPDIPDNAGRKTGRRRRRTQAIAKRYAFHANAINTFEVRLMIQFRGHQIIYFELHLKVHFKIYIKVHKKMYLRIH